MVFKKTKTSVSKLNLEEHLHKSH